MAIILRFCPTDVTEEPSDDSEVNTTMVITTETPTTAMIENGNMSLTYILSVFCINLQSA